MPLQVSGIHPCHLIGLFCSCILLPLSHSNDSSLHWLTCNLHAISIAMATVPTPNSRASLLAGLRTGGVRSASTPMANVPHTAAPAGTFNIQRHPSAVYNGSLYSTEEEDELADMVSQNLYIHNANRMQQPMTAAVDGTANRFAHQQTMGMGAAAPMSPFLGNANQAQLQALQLQMMQVELARLQVISCRECFNVSEGSRVCFTCL